MKRKFGWHIIYSFDGKPDWKELNRLISSANGVCDPFFETEDDYNSAVKEGFVKFNNYTTTIWCDGEYVEV